MSTIQVPTALMVIGSAYIGITILIGVGIAVLTSPLLIINRRKSAYFHDWNDSLKAPWLFWHIGGFWYRFTELLGNYVLPAPQRVADMAGAFMKSQTIITISELGVPDALEQGPKTGQQLASQLKVHQDYLERVLRVAERLKLVSISLPQPNNPTLKQYHITQLSAVLCQQHPNCIKHMVALFGDHLPVFPYLTEGVRTGQTPYKLYTKGKSHWEHMMEEPALYTRFNRAMTNFNNLCPVESVFMAYSFKQFTGVVDVGGGLGAFTAACLQEAPGIKGHLFDLPNVIKEAQQVWMQDRAGLLPRVSFSSGSFFDAGSIPAATNGSEAYIMRQILHDWSDADSVKILKQIRAAIGDHMGTKLVIIESCIASNLMTTTHTPRMVGDVHMMVQYGDAKERTEYQFAELLNASGFKLNTLVPTKGLFFVLEASPV